MAVVVYAFLAALVCDLVRLVHRVRPFLPEPLTPRRVVFGLGVGIALAVSAGAANAALVQTPAYDVPVEKRAGTLRELRVVLASDIHLGTVVGKQRFGRIVQAIQSLKPDVILLAGDVIDEDLAPVLAEDVGDHLRDLRAPYGVFGVTGNHEYIGGVERAVAYLEEHGIRMLRDRAVEVAGAFTVVGRDDATAERFGAPPRRPLKEILEKVDRTKPVLLLDHQPRDFRPALEEGVDLQVSGHTHHGQLWPFSLVTRAVYELSWGLERRGASHFYVSCGAGTWGPPVRLGNSPEVVLLKLQFAP
jgi:predicted MPP superfamily phosphohydrolase